jgi:hypothetical protein
MRFTRSILSADKEDLVRNRVTRYMHAIGHRLKHSGAYLVMERGAQDRPAGRR